VEKKYQALTKSEKLRWDSLLRILEENQKRKYLDALQASQHRTVKAAVNDAYRERFGD